MRQGARWHDPLLGKGDSGRFDSSNPYGEVALAFDLPKKNDGLIRGHLYPDANDFDPGNSAHVLTLRLPSPLVSLKGELANTVKTHLDESSMQSNGERGQFALHFKRSIFRVAPFLPHEWSDDLLH